jgi:hypothetical protein
MDLIVRSEADVRRRIAGAYADPDARRLGERISRHRDHLFTFLDGTAYERVAEYRVAAPERGGTDACPVLLGDRILIEDYTTLRCFRIAPDDDK